MCRFSVYYEVNDRFFKIGMVEKANIEAVVSHCKNRFWNKTVWRAIAEGDGILNEDTNEFSVIQKDGKLLKLPLSESHIETLKFSGVL